MATSTIVIIVIVAVAVILLVAGLVRTAVVKRKEHRRAQAADIRDKATEQSREVGRRQALADETAAKARAASAEADANAAQAANLRDQAAAKRSDAAASHDDLTRKFEQADKIDPDSGGRGPRSEAEPGPDSGAEARGKDRSDGR